MTKDSSSNKVTIVVAIITSVTSVIVAIVTGLFGLRAIQTQKEVELTSSAMQVIATQGGETQVALAGTAYAPTNLPYPTHTLMPTYTPLPTLTDRPTYTPYPSPLIPIIDTSTPTSEPSLIFSDNFENGISTAYWTKFGTWTTSMGKPIYAPDYAYKSRFPSQGGALILPSLTSFNNIALEFDFPIRESGFYVIFGFQDETHFKAFGIKQRSENSSSVTVGNLRFYSNDQQTHIPDSEKTVQIKSENHLRLEINGNSIKLYINTELIYDFVGLPESATGAVGVSTYKNTSQFDNIKIYQLP